MLVGAKSVTKAAGAAVEPKEMRGGEDGKEGGGKPLPKTVIENPPSLEDLATDDDDRTAVKRERFRGVQNETVCGSGETETRTELCCGTKP